MGDYGADDTGEVTSAEGNAKLCGLAVGVLWLSEDVGIEELDNLLEEEELGHCVRDLKTLFSGIAHRCEWTGCT